MVAVKDEVEGGVLSCGIAHIPAPRAIARVCRFISRTVLRSDELGICLNGGIDLVVFRSYWNGTRIEREEIFGSVGIGYSVALRCRVVITTEDGARRDFFEACAGCGLRSRRRVCDGLG